MIKVYNKRRPREIPNGAIYVGRPTKWGNPYKASKTKSRQQAIDEFEAYAKERIENEPDWLTPLAGKNLVCWCAPLPCHGDVLLRMANGNTETQNVEQLRFCVDPNKN